LPQILVAFQWAFEMRPVALILLNGADELVTPRTSELFPKFRELLWKVTKTSDPRIRCLVPAIMGANPTVFLQDPHATEQMFSALLSDRNPDVRIAVIEHFTKVRTLDPQITALILRTIATFYEDSTPELTERLCAPETYANLNASKIATILPAFITFTESVVNWRHMRNGIHTIISFPTEILQTNWQALGRIVFGWVKQYPHALITPCSQFCNIVAADLPMFECEDFKELLILEFAESPHYRARAFVPILCGTFAVAGGPAPFIGALFRRLSDLSTDPVLDVRAAVLRNLPKIRRFFAIHRDGILEREAVSLFTAIGERDDDPHIRTCWNDFSVTFSEPVSVPVPQVVHQSHSLSTGLPKLVLCGSKAPPPVPESESGGQGLFRRIRSKGILASSSVLTRQKLKGLGAGETGGLL
jgi:hypothetical protein